MALGFWQIAVIVVLFLLLFGRGKIPQLMSDVAQGIKGFRQGMRDEMPSSEDDNSVKPKGPVAGDSSVLHSEHNK
ncbi:MAG: twin-arginine translocase TatA/TatE family subunit [Spongiibacteraceae bacterium]